MNKIKFLSLFIGLIFIKCDSIEPTSVIDGNYKGIYSITYNYSTDSAYTHQGEITFSFSKGEYEYVMDKYLPPPDSRGKYGMQHRKITLTDNGRHDGFIDPTLLLNGVFNYSYNGNDLVLTQQKDEYKYYFSISLQKIKATN